MLPFPGFNLGVGEASLLLGALRLHGFWLPIAFSAVGSLVILVQPALHRRMLGPAACVLLFSGMCLAWLWSALVEHEIAASSKSSYVLTGLVVLVILSAAAVIGSVRRADARLAKRLGLMIAMCCLVGFVSSSAGGSGWMRSLLASFGVTGQEAATAIIAFRKTVHFTFYGTFAVTGYLTSLAAESPRYRAVLSGLSMAIALASFDEGRQMRAVGRTGSWWDVLLDSAGAITFLTFALWLGSRRRAQS